MIGCVLVLNNLVGSSFTIGLLVYGAILEMMVRGAHNKFPDFFVWALLLIVHA